MTIPSRVTETSMTSKVLSDLQRSLQRGQKLQSQISSGKLLNRPSDSPTGTVTALQLRTEARATQQYARNADDGLGWLGTIQDTLGDASTSMLRIRDLTVQALNATNDATSRGALANEIDNIRDTLFGQANSTFLGRPVFGGTTTGSTAFQMDPVTKQVTYVGQPQPPANPDPVTRTVGPNAKVRVETSGAEAFGKKGGDPARLFNLLNTLSADIRAGDDNAINADLANLDDAHETLKAALSDVGARYNRVEQMKQSAADHMLSVSSQLSDVEDVDLPKAIMDLQIQQTSYQAALAAASKVIQPSLIDFLR
ncbi:flagellar hook-associated protein FlgL [Actinoplanes sp. KI2]|uniref:flagellar hook-associated protein FlgL n=1 Tax=Actinoplanes sp. KI2 TaxID=2983315 RepID=UPI0021D56C26|nr:flagellar hook-associated protein FlgL [Actinoplanes sp. KI2]MCU7730131.1 flagellar hook-associated protein FlgL [Actinoplanes sp. KI2]